MTNILADVITFTIGGDSPRSVCLCGFRKQDNFVWFELFHFDGAIFSLRSSADYSNSFQVTIMLLYMCTLL